MFCFHNFGPLHHLLGSRFNQNVDGSLELDHETYTAKVLERLSMQDCVTVMMSKTVPWVSWFVYYPEVGLSAP